MPMLFTIQKIMDGVRIDFMIQLMETLEKRGGLDLPSVLKRLLYFGAHNASIHRGCKSRLTK